MPEHHNAQRNKTNRAGFGDNSRNTQFIEGNVAPIASSVIEYIKPKERSGKRASPGVRISRVSGNSTIDPGTCDSDGNIDWNLIIIRQGAGGGCIDAAS